MKIKILCAPENYTSRFIYTVDFIFNTLGFNYEIITSNEFTNTNELHIGYVNPADLKDFKDINLINISNFQLIQKLEHLEKKVNSLYIEKEKIPILGKCLKVKDISGWQKSTKSDYYYKPGSKTWQIGFDLFANVFYHLSRFEERWRNFADEFESDWANSILAQKQNLQTPTVDILLNYLKNLILLKAKKRGLNSIRILPWPKGEKFAVAFTHDIDITRGSSLKEQIQAKGKEILYNVSGDIEKQEAINKEIESKNKTIWSFSKILDFYREKNWQGTFFFLAKSFEGLHFRYNVATEQFRNLFNDLKSQNHEVALHPSLRAFDDTDSYAKEKKKLEKHADVKIQGMRQHFLRAKYPRLWQLAERAKLQYDSSLGYNFQAGFRSGTTNAHRVYDYSRDQQLELLEFPLAFFEYSLPEEGTNEQESINIINKLITTVENTGGLLTVLFHPSNFLIEPFCDYWKFLIQRLTKKNIFVTTLSEFTSWLYARNKIKIESATIETNRFEITITKPKNVSNFSFEILPNGGFEKKRNVNIENIGKNRFFCNSNLSKIKLIFNTG